MSQFANHPMFQAVKSASVLWFGFFFGLYFLLGFTGLLGLHIIFISLGAGLIFFFKVPPPDLKNAHAVLGSDPRNLDGSPLKKQSAIATDSSASSAKVSTTDLGTIAHRAAGLDAPENSIAALKLAAANGAKCVEFDLAFTKDGVAVVFHDEDVLRTTGSSAGNVSDLTWAELQKLDCAKNHVNSDDFSPERIPKVDDFVKVCLDSGVKMIIDLKSYEQPELTVKYINGLFAKNPELYENALISTFFPHLVYLIRSVDPKIVAMAWRPKFLSYRDWSAGNANGSTSEKRFPNAWHKHIIATIGDVILEWGFHEAFWHFLGLSAVLVHKDVLTAPYVQRWRERGIRVMAWTVNQSLQKAYLTDYLRVSVLSDTMDAIPADKLIQEAGREVAKESSEDEELIKIEKEDF